MTAGRTMQLGARLAAVAIIATAITGVGPHARVDAQMAPGVFSLTARADAVGTEIIATGLPVVPEGKAAFISPATAQAGLDQTVSSAFASAPYPGDLLASLPSTVNGLGAGTLPPAPAYPFIVFSDNGVNQDDSEEVGPYGIKAHSDDLRSEATARVGLSTFDPNVVSVVSHATVSRDPDSGRTVAEATTEIEPFRVNNVLSVGSIRSLSRISYDPTDPKAPITKETSLSLGTISIAGIEVGITDAGLSVAGTTLLPIDVSALSALLAPSGFSLHLLDKSETATSVQSGALELVYRGSFPSPFLDTTVRFVLGRTSATSASTALAFGGDDVGGDTSPVPPELPVPSVGGDVGLSAAPAVEVPRPPTPVKTVPTGTASELPDLGRFFPVLAAAALLAASSSRGVQWFALRRRLFSRG